jgi:hypothetical protein
MYDKFKVLLEEAECLGKIVNATMYETYASIDIVDDDGKKISLTMTIRED